MTHRCLRSLVLIGAYASLSGAVIGAPPAPQGLSPERKKALYQQHIAAAQKWKSIIEQYVAAVPASQMEIAALADSLPKPQADFEYVRDQIALEPYSGAMKGAAATLVSRGGNDLDRSLLLATILSMQGIDVQIAHGQLTPAQAQSLLQQIAAKPDATDLIEHSIPARSSASSPLTRKSEAWTAAQRQRLGDNIELTYSLLDSSLRAAKIAIGSDKSAAQLKSLEDHHWVRATVDGKTIDLDPSFAAGEYGRKYADIAETINLSGLDSARLQTMTVRLVADYLQGEKLNSQNIFESEFNTIDLWGKNIRVAILPSDAKPAANDFRATLSVGGETAVQRDFQLRVTRADKPNLPQGNNGLWGGLVGGTGAAADQAQDSKPIGAVLARLYLEIETRGPKLLPSRSRRIILDRVAANGATQRIDPALARDDVAGALVTQVWDGVIGVGPVHPLYIAKATLAWIDAYIDLQNVLIAAADSKEELKSSELPGPLLPPELLTFFLSSSNTARQIRAQFAPQVRVFYERPRLVLYRHGFVVGDWADVSKGVSYREGIDILNSPFGFVGRTEQQTRLAMRWGAADTALELRFTANAADAFNTLRLIAAATAEKVPEHTVAPDQKSALASLSVPASIKSLLERDLADNRAIVAPEHLINMNGTHTYGWWSVERDSGYAIGKMELGGAQDLTEYLKLQQAIPKASQIAGNLMGNVLRCYMGGVSGVLASGAGQSTADCLQGACCQAFNKLLAMEIDDSMSIALLMEDEEDLTTIEKLLDSIEAQGAGGVVGAAAGAGGPACDGGG